MSIYTFYILKNKGKRNHKNTLQHKTNKTQKRLCDFC